MKTNPANVDFEKRKQLNIQQNKAYRSSVWIGVVTLLMMSTYEWLKQLIYSDITIMESHVVTVVFSSIVATLVGFYFLRQRDILYGQLFKENTEREQSEELLKRFRQVMDQAGEAIFITDLNTGRFIDVNTTTCKYLGYSREELLKLSIADVELKLQSPEELFEHFEKVRERGENVFISEGIHRRKNGTTFPVEVAVSLKTINSQNIILATARDITERKQTEEKIKAALKEKETLLKEIHHRVKNNMAVIAGLLELQIDNIDDKRLKEALKESQSRVYAMSAVHEILHVSENLSEIDLKAYLSKITTSVFQTYSVNSENVRLNHDVAEISISINQASPLGLILNELISNSLKYAFPYERKGEINVSIIKLDKELELTVMDDGVGMPEGLDWKNASTLGLKLVQTLVENQLDGSINMENNNGTKFIIKFNINEV